MALPTASVMPTQRTPFQIGGGQVNTMAAGNDPGGGMNYMQAPGIGDLGSFQRGPFLRCKVGPVLHIDEGATE